MPLSERSSAYTARNCCTESNFTPTSRSTGARGCRRRSSSPGDRRGLPSGGVSRAALASALVGAESPRPTWGKGAGPARPAMGGGVESCTPPSCQTRARALNVGRGAAESGHECLHGCRHCRGRLQLERRFLEPPGIALRKDAAPEAQLCGFREPLLHLAHPPYFAGQPDLAQDQRARVERNVAEAGEDGRRHREIAGGLVQARSARHVHVDVLVGEHHALLLLQHRGEQGDPAAVDADGGASRRAATGGGRDQRRTSTSNGRLPVISAATALPEESRGRSARNSALGLRTSASPLAFISNTPISLVEPKRFLCARSTR